MTGGAGDALLLIAGAAGAFGCAPEPMPIADGRRQRHLKLEARIERPSGLVRSFRLVVTADGPDAAVKEDPEFPRQLPEFCPERHINAGGTFCLYWRDGEDIHVVDEDSASRWLATLVNFLGAQIQVERRRAWPEGVGRAHGDAARHQARAEAIARELGAGLPADLLEGRLRVRKSRRPAGGGDTLRLERAGRRLLGLRTRSRALVNLRAPCLCERVRSRKLPIKHCADHAAKAAELVLSLVAVAEEEARFWDQVSRKHRCCGTVDGCPLAKLQEGRPQAALAPKAVARSKSSPPTLRALLRQAASVGAFAAALHVLDAPVST